MNNQIQTQPSSASSAQFQQQMQHQLQLQLQQQNLTSGLSMNSTPGQSHNQNQNALQFQYQLQQPQSFQSSHSLAAGAVSQPQPQSQHASSHPAAESQGQLQLQLQMPHFPSNSSSLAYSPYSSSLPALQYSQQYSMANSVPMQNQSAVAAASPSAASSSASPFPSPMVNFAPILVRPSVSTYPAYSSSVGLSDYSPLLPNQLPPFSSVMPHGIAANQSRQQFQSLSNYGLFNASSTDIFLNQQLQAAGNYSLPGLAQMNSAFLSSSTDPRQLQFHQFAQSPSVFTQNPQFSSSAADHANSLNRNQSQLNQNQSQNQHALAQSLSSLAGKDEQPNSENTRSELPNDNNTALTNSLLQSNPIQPFHPAPSVNVMPHNITTSILLPQNLTPPTLREPCVDAIIDCGIWNSPTSRFTQQLYIAFFGKRVDIFRKANQPNIGELLFRASSLAEKFGFPTNKIAMYLGRRRYEIDGIYQAAQFDRKPGGRQGLKTGGYFLNLSACQDVENYFAPRIVKRSRKLFREMAKESNERVRIAQLERILAGRPTNEISNESQSEIQQNQNQ